MLLAAGAIATATNGDGQTPSQAGPPARCLMHTME